MKTLLRYTWFNLSVLSKILLFQNLQLKRNLKPRLHHHQNQLKTHRQKTLHLPQTIECLKKGSNLGWLPEKKKARWIMETQRRKAVQTYLKSQVQGHQVMRVQSLQSGKKKKQVTKVSTMYKMSSVDRKCRGIQCIAALIRIR